MVRSFHSLMAWLRSLPMRQGKSQHELDLEEYRRLLAEQMAHQTDKDDLFQQRQIRIDALYKRLY